MLPEKNQRKYLQFFMGIVLMILVMSPFLSALGLERQSDEIYARQTYDQELQEFLKKQEAVEEEYQRRLEEKLYEARDEAEGLKEEQQEEEKEEGEDSGISEIHIEIGEQKED